MKDEKTMHSIDISRKLGAYFMGTSFKTSVKEYYLAKADGKGNWNRVSQEESQRVMSQYAAEKSQDIESLEKKMQQSAQKLHDNLIEWEQEDTFSPTVRYVQADNVGIEEEGVTQFLEKLAYTLLPGVPEGDIHIKATDETYMRKQRTIMSMTDYNGIPVPKGEGYENIKTVDCDPEAKAFGIVEVPYTEEIKERAVETMIDELGISVSTYTQEINEVDEEKQLTGKTIKVEHYQIAADGLVIFKYETSNLIGTNTYNVKKPKKLLDLVGRAKNNGRPETVDQEKVNELQRQLDEALKHNSVLQQALESTAGGEIDTE